MYDVSVCLTDDLVSLPHPLPFLFAPVAGYEGF